MNQFPAGWVPQGDAAMALDPTPTAPGPPLMHTVEPPDLLPIAQPWRPNTSGTPSSGAMPPSPVPTAAPDAEDDTLSTSALSEEDVLRMTLASRRREVTILRAQNAALRATADALTTLASESGVLASTLAITAAMSRPLRGHRPSPWTDASISPIIAPEDFHAMVVDSIWHRGVLPGDEWIAASVRLPLRVRAMLEHEFHIRVYTMLGEWRSRWSEREALSAPVELAIQFRNRSHAAYYAANEDQWVVSVERLRAAPRGTPEGEEAHRRLTGVIAAIALTDDQRMKLRALLGEYEAEVATAAAMAGVAGIGLSSAAYEAEGGDPDNPEGGPPASLAGIADAAAAAARGAVGLAAAHNRSARAYVMLFEKMMEALTWTQFAAGSMLIQPSIPDARQFCELACGLCRCGFCTGEGAAVSAAAAGRSDRPEEWLLSPGPAPPGQ